MNSSTAAAAAAPERAKGLLARIPAPYWFSSLITLMLVIGEWFYGILGGYDRLLTCLGTAMAAEIALSTWLRGRWPHLVSAYISGNSVLMMLKPETALLWPFAAAAAISIASKYVLTFRGRHLWNPTNFGVAVMIFLAPGTVSLLSHQWGNDWRPVAIVFSIGFLVAWRACVLHITLTYLAAFAALALLRSGLDANRFLTEVGPLTGPVYMLFVFFMITDPRTIVRTRKGQVIVALVVALTECAIRMLGDAGVAAVERLLWAPPIFALFVVGPVAFVISQLRAPAPAAADDSRS